MKKFARYGFHMYTEILFGKGSEAQTGKLIRKYGGSKVLLVYGGGSIKKSGLYDRVVKTLNAEKIPFAEFGGVKPNPSLAYAEKGLELARKEGVDFLLGAGGGSAIDTAKGIALGLANNGEIWKFYTGTKPAGMAPLGTIHTLSATGTENSRSSVLVEDGKKEKKGFLWDCARPVFAIMNPELTFTVNAWQTGAGAVDIFAHTFMRYFMKGACALADEFGEGVLRTVVKYGPVAVQEPDNYEARAELMIAGSFAHNDVTGIGRTGPMAGEHPLEAQLSGYYDTTHGAGLAVVMPALLQYFVNHGSAEQIARAAQFAIKVFGVTADLADPLRTAGEGIRRFKAWLRELGMPLTLKALGVPKKDLGAVIKRCLDNNGGKVSGYLELDKEAVTEIFTSIVE
ncbi:MAG: iron-containing alcohol dehydrogenase [Treponema sp.]|jgi:alcohol dehydrogenase YqhD (iron-dependent ADH family)|nr:iron-containing alcohol dehydrogenase [Treponema sp.]